MLGHSSPEFIAGVCTGVDRIAQKIGIAFGPLADVIRASREHGGVYTSRCSLQSARTCNAVLDVQLAATL
jgi:hypothetical protein